MNFKRLKLMRAAARVKRLHVMSPMYAQSVGEHTFGLLAILFTIAEGSVAISRSLIEGCLYHDAPEAITGDVPAPVKWHHGTLADALNAAEYRIEQEFSLSINLVEIERKLLSYCDLMELAMFSCEEADSGNIQMAVVLRNTIRAIEKRKITDVTPYALELFDYVKTYAESRGFMDPKFGEDTFNGWTDYR